MTLSLALSIRDPVESGATPATNGPDITAGRCTTHRWRDPHWTKEFKLTYWDVLFVLYRVFPHHNILSLKFFFFFVCVCVVIEVYYHGLGWPPALKLQPHTLWL